MKISVATVARAVVDTARMQPSQEYAALAQAAIEVLATHGLLRESRKFLTLVERTEHKQEGIVPVKITTKNGDSGPMKKELLRVMESALRRSCQLEEQADPSVIGGLLLTIGDERFDATIRSALMDLAEKLTAPIPIP